MPPSLATSQYPPRSAVGEIPTTGRCRVIEPVEPLNCADPKLKMPPSPPTNQYPCDEGVGEGEGEGAGGETGAGDRVRSSVVEPLDVAKFRSPEYVPVTVSVPRGALVALHHPFLRQRDRTNT